MSALKTTQAETMPLSPLALSPWRHVRSGATYRVRGEGTYAPDATPVVFCQCLETREELAIPTVQFTGGDYEPFNGMSAVFGALADFPEP